QSLEQARHRAPAPHYDRGETADVYQLHAQDPVCARPSKPHPLSPLRNKGHDQGSQSASLPKTFHDCSSSTPQNQGAVSSENPPSPATDPAYSICSFLFTVHCSNGANMPGPAR